MLESIYKLIYNFLFYTQYDNVENRRKIKYPNPVKKYTKISFKEDYIINENNIKLYYQNFYPKNNIIIGKIFFLHGYASNNAYWAKDYGIKLARIGYSVYMLDGKGHGKSDGLWGYIEDYSRLVDDQYHFIKSITDYSDVKTILWGDSMGGATAIKLMLKDPNISSGTILIAPMIKIADDAKPSKSLENLFIWLSDYLPTWPILPHNTYPHSGFHPLVSRDFIYNNPLCYNKKPRLGTAIQLYNVSCEIEQLLHTISFPFLVIHGKNDKLTDWQHSKILYDKAISEDKELIIYEDCYHCLLEGPYKDIIYEDIYKWLKIRI